jgi:hypothetical protein
MWGESWTSFFRATRHCLSPTPPRAYNAVRPHDYTSLTGCLEATAA